MSVFNGLGILVEEKESSTIDEKFDTVQTEFIEDSSEACSEILLPPLPDESEIANNQIFANTQSKNESRSASVSGMNSPYLGDEKKQNFEANSQISEAKESDYSELLSNSCLSSHDLSSLSGGAGVFAIDSSAPFQIFPSISTPAKGKEGKNNTDKDVGSSSQQSTSPLKRLKSLKNGIRKLSLSSLNSNSSVSKSAPATNSSTPITSQRPILSPIQTSIANSEKSLSQDSSSTNSDSYESSSNTDNNPSSTTNSHSLSIMTNSSYPLSISKRSRAFSGSALTPITPPYSSPVITLSDNLQNSKKSLLNIEHSYFDALNVSKSQNHTLNNIHGAQSNSSNSSSARFDYDDDLHSSNSPIHSVSELSKPSELIDYFMFLKEQKKTVIDAFEVTTRKLKESGWCSEHDLNNLQLQQDSSLCQLDTKLLQIKERLDTEFNMSLFNESTINSQGNNASHHSNGFEVLQKQQTSSPSLKVLENRCFSFSEIK
ncbi:hypothetical protein CLIB1423_14S01112 [[Candida] railenensis]|uniref:Uncharacterized protein n=1 Tax=[Candida] railenensis TaxID=45579 RepID=A0A9P0VZZ9_9ASCO|nr:hypothetical protein CLIB1423_14S01112 [[Candida] railenensis]